MAFPTGRLQSPPVRIHWLGFEGTSYTMQQAGWEFQIMRSEYTFSYKVIFSHKKLKTYGMFHVDDVWREYQKHEALMDISCSANLVGDIVWRMQEQVSFPYNFEPIDMTPRYVDHYISKMNLFAPKVMEPEKSIIVPQEPSVQELLDKILAKQQSGQQQYFENLIKQKQIPEAKVCQIIQLRA